MAMLLLLTLAVLAGGQAASGAQVLSWSGEQAREATLAGPGLQQQPRRRDVPRGQRQQAAASAPLTADSPLARPAAARSIGHAADAGFDLEAARLMALLQSISYCPVASVAAWNCTRCGRVPGFQTLVAHFDPGWDLVGYAGYLPSLNAKVLAFRGTDSGSFYNWAENMRAWRTDATYPVPGAPRALRLHSGFNILWNVSTMAATFNDAWRQLAAKHPDGPTYILGHSMGGALAQLCALDLATVQGARDVRVYTFGSPRVGNVVFSRFFGERMAQSWRFTHGRDIVPSVPMTILGFHHAAREVWLVDLPAQAGAAGGAAAAAGGAGVAPGAGAAWEAGQAAGERAQAGATVQQQRRRRLARWWGPANAWHSWRQRGGGAPAAAAAHSGRPRGAAAAAAELLTVQAGLGDEPAERIIVCDDSGEDPSCHNSACALGMCTSVADHLVYLGTHMYGGSEC